MQRIALLTSGGDSPGMNACIRAVVRKAVYHGLEVMGIKRGYNGFIEADMTPMNTSSVSDIIQRGGTILQTARSDQFLTPEGRDKAFQNVRRFGIQGLVAVGGDGTFRGAGIFNREYGLPVVGVPSTIDNDIPGTDRTIGFDTAVNTAVEAINKIRDTATSHERTFIIEVMGRNNGFIALEAGLAGGAESILIPERPFNYNDICERLLKGYRRGKLHSIIVVAEGAADGMEVGRKIKECTNLETKVIILGHLQRGGAPSAADRVLASRMGSKAVELLMAGETRKMVSIKAGEIVSMDIDDVLAQVRSIDLDLYHLAGILSI
ncbi:MAG: 6-phosphofructokinase [Pelotomaculum thermopropionicum]|uniref:ATP-dependent 6-phosphofructokinase n=1 Tax=Pelotomaculum thermopropionicum TaxID=110500 RepID=A0A101HSX2_9FIRM|nr:MAG: 6-phosphofructokinase [Pelotomaculum thermopropionicum]